MDRSPSGKLVLIDGNSLLYRAFFALPPLTNASGEMTNAVYGFTSMLLKVLDEERPDMIAVAFDLPGPTFRHRQYADYKATRPKTPDELAAQIGMAREVLAAMHIPVYDYEGYEADDVIGTLASAAEQAGHRVLIVTGDLDELQLVSDKVSVMVTRRGITDTKVYDVAAVQERYGFAPERLPDFRALKGDTTDNIPGVPGIGEKTAAELVKRFGTLDEVLAHVEEVTPARVAAALESHADLARQAHQLSTIVRDLSMKLDREELAVKPPDRGKLLSLFRRLDFRTLAARIPGRPETVRLGQAEASAPETREAAARVSPTRQSRYGDGASEEPRVIATAAEAAALAQKLSKEKEVVLHPIAEEGPGLRAQMRGLCVLSAEGPAVLTDGAGALGKLLAALKPALESGEVAKIGHDLKRLALLLSRHGIALRGMAFDTMIASYLSSPSRRAHDLASAIYDHLESAAGEQFALEVPNEAGRAAAAAEHIAELRDRLSGKLREREQWKLFAELEMPLVQVLLDMELVGVAVDSEALGALSERLGQRVRELEQAIYLLAGEEFTISSPKQLQRILFDKLGLPPDKTKRTKTGYSTDAEVLGGLSEHEIVASILEYREITKLKSTYVDVLPRLVDPESGRLHTSFNQAVTATGRLSSSDPNLQNIPRGDAPAAPRRPVRTELGSEIRRAFVPGRPGHVLLSADYSQIELRILAHITQDANLIEIFRRDEDLHRAAAMEIFGVRHDEITPAMRAFAKMVNFGIPYGISEFRLAREMGITAEEARRYVQRYFARFPQLHAYVREMPERAREAGYVTTLLGRRRYLPELKARAPMVRQAAERMAVNTPMQGSAADIIKLAMLRVHERLSEEGYTAKMILQVHDELLLQAPRGELQAAARLVAECMSGAYELVVSLKVDLKAGPNWLEMEPVELQ